MNVLSLRRALHLLFGMDSLLATYASSDEDDGDLPRQQPPPKPNTDPKPSSSTSFFTSLPPPKSSSLFGSVPPPKSHNNQNPKIDSSQYEAPLVLGDQVSRSGELFNSQASQTLDNQSKKAGSFPSLPAPKFGDSIGKASLNLPAPKKVVQFKPPVISLTRGEGVDDEDDDDDEDDEEEMERKRRRELQSSNEAPSVKSFLSSIPAPKNSKAALGALPSSGSGRRSIIDAEVPSLKQQHLLEQTSSAVDSNGVDSDTVAVDYQCGYVDASGSITSGVDSSNWYQPVESYGDLAGGSNGGYENYGGYGQYESNWIDRSGSDSMPEAPAVLETMTRVMGKRGRNDIPTDFIEVKQDELMKNRPKEDQVKATGIAFGPSYQPVSAAKGKPSKLHKRKHQIGALYFDMKQKESELAERRSRGYLTKAETHAKYGW